MIFRRVPVNGIEKAIPIFSTYLSERKLGIIETVHSRI
jgi:hypothetical protein